MQTTLERKPKTDNTSKNLSLFSVLTDADQMKTIQALCNLPWAVMVYFIISVNNAIKNKIWQ